MMLQKNNACFDCGDGPCLMNCGPWSCPGGSRIYNENGVQVASTAFENITTFETEKNAIAIVKAVNAYCKNIDTLIEKDTIIKNLELQIARLRAELRRLGKKQNATL